MTEPFDMKRAEAHADRVQFERLRSGWWWIVPLAFALGVGAPIFLWRRAQRRFFSMRLPGPGTEVESMPPSSLDPVGAAVLIAGARPVNPAAVFAGHVLDLIERKQLQMRRTLAPELGGTGALIGLAHADDGSGSEDPAIAALRSVAEDDEITVAVPDAAHTTRIIGARERESWQRFVQGRERFERMVNVARWERIVTAAAATGAFTLLALVSAIIASLEGARASAWLATTIGIAATALLIAWALDARRWRNVDRARRLERAQWIAWRRVVGTQSGPALDQRNLAVVVATGPVDRIIRRAAGPDEVGLDALTTKTVASLVRMCEPPQS